MRIMEGIPPDSWKPVPGWEGFYEASHRGYVRGLRHRWGLRPEPLVLSPKTACRDGRHRVILKAPGRKPETRLIHHLVLEAHAGQRPGGMDALHGPGGFLDNRWPENVYWGTKSRNNGIDKVRDGTSNRGERGAKAKLTLAQIEIIKNTPRVRGSQAKLARDLGIDPSHVSRIINGQVWAWTQPGHDR